MIMKSFGDNRAGRSDPQCRQGGAIVPGPPRSGPLDEPYYGLLPLLAASSGGEGAIAGLVSACRAGVLTRYAPALRRLGSVVKPLTVEVVGGFGSPLRLRGGANNSDSSNEDKTSNERTGQRRRREVVSPSTDETRPGPSDIRRSRSRVRAKSTSRTEVRKEGVQTRNQRAAQKAIQLPWYSSSGEEDEMTRQLSDDISPVRPRDIPAENLVGDNAPINISEEEDKPEEDIQVSRKRNIRSHSNTRGLLSSDESSSSKRSPPRKKPLGPKSKRAKSKPAAKLESATQTWEVPEKRGRGRPPTTGEYRNIIETKKALNNERQRELRLAQEEKVTTMEDTLKLLRRAHLDPEDTAEKAKLDLTADIASRIREAQAEVIRVARISNNLQGPLQRTLKVAASTTMGLADVLRTRADETAEVTGNEELRKLHVRVAKLTEEQEKMHNMVRSMKEEMEKAKEDAESAKRKVKNARQDLQDSIRRNEELKRQLKEARQRAKPKPQPA